jgi:hypothetical protein
MREGASLIFAWRAEPDQVAGDRYGAVYGDLSDVSALGGVGLLVDASPRHHDFEWFDIYSSDDLPAWDTDGSARLSGSAFGAAQTTSDGSTVEQGFGPLNADSEFVELHRDGEFALVWRGVWRELFAAPGAVGDAVLFQTSGSGRAGVILYVDSATVTFQVKDSSGANTVSLTAAATWNEEDIVTIAVRSTAGASGLELLFGDGGAGNLTVVDTDTFATGGTGDTDGAVACWATGSGVYLSTIGLVIVGSWQSDAELDAWELWIDGADYSDEVPVEEVEVATSAELSGIEINPARAGWLIKLSLPFHAADYNAEPESELDTDFGTSWTTI